MKEEVKGILLDMSLESFVMDDYILKRLKQDALIYQKFQTLPELYLRIRIDNIQSVRKNAVLHHRRLNKFIENTRKNQMYGQCNDNGRLFN